MINRLKRKFIFITAASVLLVIVFVIGAINIINLHNRYEYLDSVTQQIYNNQGAPKSHQQEEKHDGSGKTGGKGKKDPLKEPKETGSSLQYCTMRLSQEGQIEEYNLDRIVSIEETDLPQIAAQIQAAGAESGWYGHYRYRMERTDTGSFIVVLDGMAIRDSIRSVLLISLAAGLVAFILVLVLVWIFSAKAIRPVAQAYEKQKQFITDASHELKTPLTVISADAQLLEMTYGENEWCDGINKQTALMCTLIGKMLQLAKLDENAQNLSSDIFNFSDAVYDTAMSFSGPAHVRGISLEVNTAPNLYIRGNEGMIRQVVSILVDNAVKYCDENGKIEVSAANVSRPLFKGRTELTVRNTFRAAQSLDGEKLFDRFYRGDPSHAANNSYGLGLPIAKMILEKHNGTIGVKLEEEHVAFTVMLPPADAKKA